MWLAFQPRMEGASAVGEVFFCFSVSAFSLLSSIFSLLLIPLCYRLLSEIHRVCMWPWFEWLVGKENRGWECSDFAGDGCW